jgi:galactofuranose transport system permease protein
MIDILMASIFEGSLFGQAFAVTAFDVLFWAATGGLIVLAVRRKSTALWPLVALAALLAFNRVFTESFFLLEVKSDHLYGSLIDILNRGAPIMLVALGMTLVIATEGVDLSVGAVVAIAGSLSAQMIADGHTEVAMIVAVVLTVCVLMGAWNGVLVSFFGVQPIVATLILMVAGRGIAQLITDGQIITFQHEGFSAIGGGHFLALPFTVTLVVVTLIVTAGMTRLTAMGLFIESAGDNQTASRYAGLKVRWIKTFAYAFSGLCAGVAGLIVVSDIKAADANNAGMFYELDAILAVVIGGTALTGGRFHLLGSLVGALIIQTLTTTIYSREVDPEYTLVVKAVVVLIVCLIQSEALRALIVKRRVRT